MSVIGPEGRKQLKLAARFASAGFELAIAVVLGLLGGRWLDVTFGTEPYLGNISLVLGLFVGFRNLFRLAKSAHDASEKPPDDSTP